MDDPSGHEADVQIRLLGPLELVVGGRTVPAGGPRQRALLALLALSVGLAIPPPQLVDLLWDEAPPPAAANTVQVYVCRLRRLLVPGGGRSPLLSVSGAYVLDLPPEAIDAGRFEVLSERGRGRLAAGDPVAAAADLRAALAIWRGSALPELAGTVVGQGAVARLDAMRLATLADRIDADALLGRHAALIPELQGLIRQYPLDERFVGQLMTALYRAGRQAEAFTVYATAAHRLAEELGLDPGPALRGLHTRILRQDEELEAPALKPIPSQGVPRQLRSGSLSREHECDRLLPLSEAVSLLGSVLVNVEPAVAARLLAAAEAWRSAGPVPATGIGNRLAEAAAAAEAGLVAAVRAGKLSAEQLAAERRRGARTPVGSLRGLLRIDLTGAPPPAAACVVRPRPGSPRERLVSRGWNRSPAAGPGTGCSQGRT